MAAEFKALHPNGLSFVAKQAGRNGREVHHCRLRKEKFITIATPEYVDGMKVEDARAAWAAYLRKIQPSKYPSV